MRALLDDAPALHHQDAVGVDDGGEAMGDDERRAARHQRIERALHERFVFRVERGSRLVEQQHRRVFQDRAGDRQPLPLAARQRDAALADQRVVALRQRLDEKVGGGADGGGADFASRLAPGAP